MEALYFVIVAIALYFVSDRVLTLIEDRRGRRFEERSLIFFFILLGLALLTFTLIGRIAG